MLQCREIFPTGNLQNRALFTLQKNKISVPCQIVDTARTAPKSYQGQTQTFGSQFSRFRPNWLTFGGVIADRVKAVLWTHRVSP